MIWADSMGSWSSGTHHMGVRFPQGGGPVTQSDAVYPCDSGRPYAFHLLLRDCQPSLDLTRIALPLLDCLHQEYTKRCRKGRCDRFSRTVPNQAWDRVKYPEPVGARETCCASSPNHSTCVCTPLPSTSPYSPQSYKMTCTSFHLPYHPF